MAGLTLKGAFVAALAAVASALPAAPKLSERELQIHEVVKRQTPAEMALGINDFDVLQL